MPYTRRGKQKRTRTRRNKKQRGGDPKRIMRDVVNASKLGEGDPAFNMYYAVDGDNLQKGYAMVIAPRYSDFSKEQIKTAKFPYEECVFFFSVDLSAQPPNHYPNAPPKFKHETPNIKNYRIHPNMYEYQGKPSYDGKVCLGILGTWGNNDWKSTMTISDVLQGLMGILEANPGRYEPGLSGVTDKLPQGVLYNRHVFYECLDITAIVYDKVINSPSSLPVFVKPFTEHLSKRAYSATSYLINKIEEFIRVEGKSTIELKHNVHHDEKNANFGALKDRFVAIRESIPTDLRKNVFKYGTGELWRELYKTSNPKRPDGTPMTYEEFAEEMEARTSKPSDSAARKKSNASEDDYEYVYSDEE